MKKTKLIFFLIAAFLLLDTNSATSQDNIVFPQSVKSIFQGKGIIFLGAVLTTGDSCNNSANFPEKHDGPQAANGYEWPGDSNRFVIKFSPATVGHPYPWIYNKVCIGVTGTSNVASENYWIVMYDSTPTGPGANLYTGPTRTFTSIPNYPLFAWYSSPDSLPTINHAVYIGVRYNNTGIIVFASADESASTPLWPGYTAGPGFPPAWQTIQSAGYFAAYRCMKIRAEGHSTLQPICEGFNSTIFPPSGWTNTNATLIYRSNASGFQMGVGSAYFDFWNVVSGTGDLTTLAFIPSEAGDVVQFTLAHCPFGSPDDILLQGSTNGGTTFTTIFDMTSVWMQTTTGCTRPFIPSTAGQWQRRGFPVPVGTNKIRFHATTAFGDGAYIDSICVVHPTGISNNERNIPEVYSLSQNYPNPFNPISVIRFALPKAGNVELKVYDVLGAEVKSLVNEFKPAGNYTVEFDGSNLPSGVYFYKLQAGGFTATKKMVLIK